MRAVVRLRTRLSLLLLVTVMAGGRPATAEDPKNWIGARVVDKLPGFALREGNKTIRPTPIYVYRVERVEGVWLRLCAPGVAGWARKDEVVLADQAIEYFTLRIRSNPRDVHAYVMRSNAWIDANEPDRALSDCDEVIRIDPSGSYGYYNRARAWFFKEEFNHALADLNRAIELNPSDADGYGSRGAVWAAKGQFDRAILDADRAIRLNPNLAAPYNTRGAAFWFKQDLDRALADFDKAIQLDPEYAMAFNNRGGGWMQKQESDRAVADFDKAITLDPNYHMPYSNRGAVWLLNEDLDRALADYNEAIRLNPSHVPSHVGRILVSLSRGDYNRALADCAEMIRIDPKSAQGYVNRTGIFLIAGSDGAGYAAYECIERCGWKGGQPLTAVLFAYFGERRFHREVEAQRLLDEAATNVSTSEWHYAIVRYLRREIDEKDLVSKANDENRQAEIRAFVGLDRLLSGHQTEAIEHFQWVTKHCRMGTFLRALAEAELGRLGVESAKSGQD